MNFSRMLGSCFDAGGRHIVHTMDLKFVLDSFVDYYRMSLVDFDALHWLNYLVH